MNIQLLPFTDLQIPEDRQRKVFDETAHAELSTSISKHGLLQPIVVKNNNVLVAGERRFRAIKAFYDMGLPIKFKNETLPQGMIPVLDQGDIDELTAKEMELAENLYRRDLTWQEHSRAVAELHELRSAQKAATGQVQSFTDTAREVYQDDDAVGGKITQVVEAVHLARHLDDPDVIKAKSQKEAVKIVKKKLDEQRRADQALEFSKKESKHRLFNDDCVNFLMQYAGPKFDILLTDPPYGVDMDSCTSWDGTKHEYDDSADNLRGLLENIFNKLPLVM